MSTDFEMEVKKLISSSKEKLKENKAIDTNQYSILKGVTDLDGGSMVKECLPLEFKNGSKLTELKCNCGKCGMTNKEEYTFAKINKFKDCYTFFGISYCVQCKFSTLFNGRVREHNDSYCHEYINRNGEWIYREMISKNKTLYQRIADFFKKNG